MDSPLWTSDTVENSLQPLTRITTRKLNTAEYRAEGRYPIVDQGQRQIAGWTDSLDAVITEPLPLIVFGDHTRIFKFIDFPFVRGADGTQLLRPRSGIDPLFFFYACRSIDLQTRGYNRHFSILKQKTIPIPKEESEQRLIATALRRVEQSMEDHDDALALLHKIKEATMKRLFSQGLRGDTQKDTEIGPIPNSWDVVRFESVRDWLQYGTSVPCASQPSKYPVLRIPNVEAAFVNTSDLKYCDIAEETAEKYLLEDGDVLFIRTNGVRERLGKCAVYSGNPQKALFASYLIRARPLFEKLTPHFAAYFFSSELGTRLVSGGATPAADGKFNLNTGAIDSILLPLPPSIVEQDEIVKILQAIDIKLLIQKQKRAVLQELFESLLGALMTGQIRVADLDLSALKTKAMAETIA
jgi:restriction endonuclease S subunit